MDSRENPCLPSLALEILYSELQAALSMLMAVPSVGTLPNLGGRTGSGLVHARFGETPSDYTDRGAVDSSHP